MSDFDIDPQAVMAHVLDHPLSGRWPDLARVMRRAAAARPRAWGLPALATQAVGGDPMQALTACAALACVQVSIVLVDDLLDADPRGEHHRLGAGGAANLALGLQALAGDILAGGVSHTPMLARALTTVQRALAVTSYGQSLDAACVDDEAAYWRVVSAKSGAFFGAAWRLGAECAGAGPSVVDRVEALGHCYGEIVQIHDDLGDCLQPSVTPDWRLGRSPLPILYARLVAHPDRERFSALCARIEQPGALAEAQEILWRSGAVSYCLHQILGRHAQAQALLGEAALPVPEPLQALFTDLIRPVDALLA